MAADLEAKFSDACILDKAAERKGGIKMERKQR
jgi:hypothetical protein